MKIVPTLLGITAVAALAMVATSVQSRVSQYNDYRRSRLASRDVFAGAWANGPRARAALVAVAPPTAKELTAAEKMFPSGRTKDFGAVRHGTKLLYRFPITNVHPWPMRIAHLQGSCDCVTATAANRLLQPGESSTIDVRLDAGDFEGKNTQTVRVKVNGPDFSSTCRLVVSAVSEKDKAESRTARN